MWKLLFRSSSTAHFVTTPFKQPNVVIQNPRNFLAHSKHIIVYNGLSPLVYETHDSLQLATFSINNALKFVCEEHLFQCSIYLCRDENKDDWFAVSSSFDKSLLESTPPTSVLSNNFLRKLSLFNRKHFMIFGYSRSMINWQLKNQYCGACGSRTKILDAGHRIVCKKCSEESRGSAVLYPTITPTVLTLVVSKNTDFCILGRKPTFPPGYYSCLAGFVSPGESAESSVIREIAEETSLSIDPGSIIYEVSQSWPFTDGSQLALGFTVHSSFTNAESLKCSDDELEDVRWFSRKEVNLMLNNKHPQFRLPPKRSLSNYIIRKWATEF